METNKNKQIVKIVIYVVAVILIIWVGYSIFGGSKNGDVLNEVTETGTVASTTDATLLTELKNAKLVLDGSTSEVQLNNGSVVSGKKGSLRQVTLGNVAVSKKVGDREDVFAFIQDGKEHAVAFAYLVHFIREGGSLKFVDSVKIGAFSDISDMKTIDINNKETGEEYSVVLEVLPYTVSTKPLDTSIHFSVAIVNGKLSPDTVEIN